MSTTIDALRELGEKVNGTKPISNYTGNIINEIADNYTGGGSGSGIYTFDYSAATATGDYSFSLAINNATMQELLAQPVIDLTLGTAVSNVLETSHITVTKGLSDSFSGACVADNDTVMNVLFNLTSSAATLTLQIQEIPESSGGGNIIMAEIDMSNVEPTEDPYTGAMDFNKTITQAKYEELFAADIIKIKVSEDDYVHMVVSIRGSDYVTCFMTMLGHLDSSYFTETYITANLAAGDNSNDPSFSYNMLELSIERHINS